MTTAGEAQWVLYIAQSKEDEAVFDRGSRMAVGILEDAELGDKVLVQNVEILRRRKVQLPDWLLGTPTLVSRSDSLCFRGSDAVRRLRELVDEAATEREDEAAAPEERPSAAPQEAIGMVAPGQRFLVPEGDEAPSLELTTPPQPTGTVRDGPVTDSDLAAYIAARNESPAGSLMPAQQA